MMPLLLIALQAAGPVGPVAPLQTRFDHCVDRATNDPPAGEAEAGRWQLDGGGFLAGQCLGIAYANEARWAAAAAAFESAAQAAERAHDTRSANYWAQAGNAWLAGKEPARARAALDAAIAGNTLKGLASGEAHLDRARAIVAGGGESGEARSDIDRALADAPGDPLAWLLSATLARRTGDLTRARADIGRTLALSADDASVQLEAGNIAAASGDGAAAKAAWIKAAGLQPASASARAALAALKQFDAKP